MERNCTSKILNNIQIGEMELSEKIALELHENQTTQTEFLTLNEELKSLQNISIIPSEKMISELLNMISVKEAIV